MSETQNTKTKFPPIAKLDVLQQCPNVSSSNAVLGTKIKDIVNLSVFVCAVRSPCCTILDSVRAPFVRPVPETADQVCNSRRLTSHNKNSGRRMVNDKQSFFNSTKNFPLKTCARRFRNSNFSIKAGRQKPNYGLGHEAGPTHTRILSTY